MRRVASIVPSWAAVFLVVMAILIDSPALFYMATAMFCTIGACRLQAWLSVRALRIERVAPPAVTVGELVTVSMVIWSERRLKRPLVSIWDSLPERLVLSDRTPSFPVAPSYDQPIQTRYSFRPLRRGHFRWSTVSVRGTDVLGLVTMDRIYRTEPTELVVYPAAIPVNIPISPKAGVGMSEAESGLFRGQGIEPRGVREYQPGDPQRYVHWASSARSRTLMVKEFEVGSGMVSIFLPQRTSGSEVGDGDISTLEAMCGHAKYLSDAFLRQGSVVLFPTLEDRPNFGSPLALRRQEIDEILALVQADHPESISEELLSITQILPPGGTLFLMLSVADPGLPNILAGLREYQRVCLIYDCDDYPRKSKAKIPNAANSMFLEQLRMAGAEVFVMPKVGNG